MGALISILAIGLVFLCGALAWLPGFQPSAPAAANGEQAWPAALGDLAQDLRWTVEDLAASAPDAIQDAALSLQDSLPGALQQAEQSASEIVGNLRDSAADALESIGEWLGSLRGG